MLAGCLVGGCLDDLAGTRCNPGGTCGEGYVCDRAEDRCVHACPAAPADLRRNLLRSGLRTG